MTFHTTIVNYCCLQRRTFASVASSDQKGMFDEAALSVAIASKHDAIVPVIYIHCVPFEPEVLLTFTNAIIYNKKVNLIHDNSSYM